MLQGCTQFVTFSLWVYPAAFRVRRTPHKAVCVSNPNSRLSHADDNANELARYCDAGGDAREPESSLTLRWRGLDSNFQYASAMNLVVAPASLGRVGAPFCQPILSGTQPKDTRSAIAVAGSLCRLPTLPKQTGAAKGRQPASLPPRTGSSNPVPSSGESLVNLTSTLIILPSPLWVFDLAAPTGAPIYTKSPGEVSAWGAVGRTCCETDPPATGSGSLVANVGHGRIT
jgi:hypothetical protein